MDSDAEDYGLEYSDESDQSEPDVQLENQYYAAKGLKADAKGDGALKAFKKVLELEMQKGDWGFKALKQMIKITFNRGDYTDMLGHYSNLLEYLKSAVTKNYAEKSVNHILDYVSASTQTGLLQKFYETTLATMLETSNDRLWFKTMVKLGKLFFDTKQFERLKKVLGELHKSCQNNKGEVDRAKGTQLLEIYALEIQMYTEEKNDMALQELYEKSIHVESAIPHPLIMGTIRECGGKMHLRHGAFDKANTDFFEAFKNYDESGSARRIVCLKYFVLSNMLMKSDINPFDSQETNPFRNEPEILAMTKLVSAYQGSDVKLVEKILYDEKAAIMADPFIQEHVGEILRNVRSEVLFRIVKPYVCVQLSYLAEELKISRDEVIDIMAALIRSKCKQLRIDQINGTIMRIGHGQNLMDEKLASAMKNMCSQLESLQKILVQSCR